MWMDHCLFNHSPIEGHLGCFQFGVARNKTAMTLWCFYYILLLLLVFYFSHARKCVVISYLVLICISLMPHDTERLFMYLLFI